MGPPEPGHERQIVKTKRFAIEPMFEEDAVAAMEDLGHDFYVFVNAENERVACCTGARRRLRADRAGRRRRVHVRPAGGRRSREVRRGGSVSREPAGLAAALGRGSRGRGRPRGDEAVVDEVAAQRRDVRVEQREPLVDLLLGIVAVLGEDALEQEAQDDLPLAVLGRDRRQPPVDEVRAEHPASSAVTPISASVSAIVSPS